MRAGAPAVRGAVRTVARDCGCRRGAGALRRAVSWADARCSSSALRRTSAALTLRGGGAAEGGGVSGCVDGAATVATASEKSSREAANAASFSDRSAYGLRDGTSSRARRKAASRSSITGLAGGGVGAGVAGRGDGGSPTAIVSRPPARAASSTFASGLITSTLMPSRWRINRSAVKLRRPCSAGAPSGTSS